MYKKLLVAADNGLLYWAAVFSISFPSTPCFKGLLQPGHPGLVSSRSAAALTVLPRRPPDAGGSGDLESAKAVDLLTFCAGSWRPLVLM